MRKSCLVKELAKKHNLSKKEAEQIINDFLNLIIDALKTKESVVFSGFGSFVPFRKKEREVFLPGTNIKVKIKPTYSVKFRPSKKLQELLEKEIED